ncbi:ABC transporter permease [Clostridia bacterium]|nr:ABC transporter permease [Clostridia bacterium]
MTKLKSIIFGSFSTILFFVVWYILSKTGVLNRGVLPDPLTVIARLFKNLADLRNGTLPQVGISFRRAGLGFLAALGVGLVLGALLQTFLKKIKHILVPVFQLLERMHPFALFPVFMLFWGISEKSKIIIVFWVALWPILFYTAAGIENVDTLIVKAAKTMGADKVTLFFRVILPAALPDIYAGVKFSAQIAFVLIVSIEMLSSSSGIGYLLILAKRSYNLPDLYSGIILVAILGIVMNKILTLAESRLFSYKEKLI